MKIKDLVKVLQKYENQDAKLSLKLIPNDGTEADGDENDLDLRYVGEIYTGGLDSHYPFIEVGFQIIN